MITKERLEELIKNCAVIYGIEYNQIEIYDLSDTDICMSPANFRDYGLRVFNSLGYWNDIKFEDLFENKEDAEWHREFGCIERTERLVLPTWEELDTFFEFKDKDGCDIVLIKAYSKLTLTKYNKDNIAIYQYFSKRATKENYTLACRKCVELFLGEKK